MDRGHGGGGGGGRLVKLPLGSLRASFGYMSRFEDAWALLSFLRQHYTDRTADDPPVAAPSGASSGGSEEDAARELRRQRMRWATVQGPGWC